MVEFPHRDPVPLPDDVQDSSTRFTLSPRYEHLSIVERGAIWRTLSLHAMHHHHENPEGLDWLVDAPLFIVASDIGEVLVGASDEVTAFHSEDCFQETDSGFAYFSVPPLITKCEEGHDWRLAGFWWRRLDDGVVFADIGAHSRAPESGDWDVQPGFVYSAVPRAEDPSGTSILMKDGLETFEDAPSVRLAAALHAFMQSRVVTMSRPSISRQVRRRWEREDRKPELGATVITLRRSEPAEPNGSVGPRKYGVRWLVREHIRMQPVGPGRLYRRPTVVSAHIKGPSGAPLKSATAVYKVVR